MNGKVKILLVQIMNRNFGDAVIAENTLFLLHRALRNFDDYEILNYNIFTRDLAQVKYVDVIIFAGGGIIKFEQEEFWKLLYDILYEAQKRDVPVFINAAGVEGYQDDDERCQKLKDAINLNCVKCISVRDDMNTLKNKYITNKEIRVKSVFDPAICSSSVYNIKKNVNSNCIGVGIAREMLFSDYGHEEINREYLVNFYKELVKNIENLGYKWVIFTNGSLKDNEFAEEVLKEIGYGDKIIIPKCDRELVSAISSFKGIIACRMHANIIAYALNIPSIGLVWNNKLMYWGKKIGYIERFICPDSLSADRVTYELSIALKKGCRKVTKWQKYITYKEISYFVRRYCKARKRATDNIDYAQYVAAMALGGYNYIYRNMNSLSTLSRVIDNGYQWIEIDIRLTADNELVCVDGWNQKTYAKLGMKMEEDQSNRPMMYHDFKRVKYYGVFDTADFLEFVDAFFISRTSGVICNLIIDMGIPDLERFEVMMYKVQDIIKKHPYNTGSIYIRLQGDVYVELMRKKDMEFNIIYQLTDIGTESIDFCIQNGITMVCLKKEQCTDKTIQMLKKSGLDVCVFYCMKIGDINKYIRWGVTVIGSSYYDICYMNQLTK